MFNSWSFKLKLQVSLGLLSAIALGIVGYLAYELHSDLVADKKHLLGRSAESIADKVDRNLFERYGDVQAFAMSEPARSGSPERITKFMTDMMSAYAPIYDVMMVLDLKGNVIAVNAVDKSGKALDTSKMLGKNYADQDWFQAAAQGKVAPGAAHFTDLRFDNDTKDFASVDGKVMNFTSPIRDANTGNVLGVWSNRMSWKDVVEDILVKESQKLKDESLHTVAAYLVNQDGLYIVHNDAGQILKGKAADAELFKKSNHDTWAQDIDDKDLIKEASIEVFTVGKGYATYPGMKWIYILRGPTNDADLNRTLMFSILGVGIIIFVAAIAWVVSTNASRSLERVITKLASGSTKVSHTAHEVTNSAHSLSEASTEQASALQETAASIEEINAMIKKSNENSSRSQEVAGQSSEIAKRGKESVEKVSQAINEINVSNEAILKQISESNSQISDIARVIAEIGNKTRVINDIVFQTKLLSFNASVEAARAGEHGKGFAVVAEEVGNLAQMSGNAAKEISEMLAESIKNVESIVEQTKQRVEHLISDGRQKVQSGIVIADQCGHVLNEVVTNVDELNTMVTEISVASQEQSQGVNEITKAMNELDQTTHANATTSQHVSGYASSLSHEAKMMNEMVAELTRVVTGGKTVSNSAETSEPEAKQQKDNLISFEQPKSVERPVVKKLKKVSGDSLPSSDDPRFKDV